MSETLTGSLDVQRFELREEDVTCCIEQLCCGRSKLIMGEEEVELNKNCWGPLCSSTKRGRKFNAIHIIVVPYILCRRELVS